MLPIITMINSLFWTLRAALSLLVCSKPATLKYGDLIYANRKSLSIPWVGNLLHLKSQISPFVTIRNPAGAAKLPSGPQISVIPKMIPEKRSLFTFKRNHDWGFKEPHVALEPQVADPGLYS